MKSYSQACAIARALDVVGERWSLLVVRELLLGPKRFGELRGRLPGIPPTLLSARLRELTEAGVISHRALPPPSPVSVYDLTDLGRGLEPAILALANWGRQLPAPNPELAADHGAWAGLGMKASVQRLVQGGVSEPPLAVRCTVDGETFTVRADRTGLHVEDGPGAPPDAELGTDLVTFRRLRAGLTSLDDALGRGLATLGGDRRAVERLFTITTTMTAA
jgi:DNA-binding HxlR family transcriptional regulator